MNQHCSIIMSKLGLLYETDLIVISADYYVHQKPKNNEIKTLQSDMKGMKTQITELQDQVKNNAIEIKREMNENMNEIKFMMQQLLNQRS